MGADAELRAILHLRSLPKLKDRVICDLLSRYGSARAALAAPESELGSAAAEARGSRPIVDKVERALRTIGRWGIEVLAFGGPRYPERLKELHDPPPVLFAHGRLELLERRALAIVGARRPSSYGRDLARGLSAGVSRAGIVVVSGMARGIDGIAHAAALAGGTIGVLGSGVDVIYPRESTRLFRRIREEGLLLSEFMPGEPPLRYHFPRRNRLIAALSEGVLVVEASAGSGSLITVEHALDLGREVMAVPGPIGRDLSTGTNELLRDGATIILGVRDILAALGVDEATSTVGDPYSVSGSEDQPEAGRRGVDRGSAPTGITDPARRLWKVLDMEPLHAEILASASGLDSATTLAGLLELEVAGYARQLPGLRFVRRLDPLVVS